MAQGGGCRPIGWGAADLLALLRLLGGRHDCEDENASKWWQEGESRNRRRSAQSEDVRPRAGTGCTAQMYYRRSKLPLNSPRLPTTLLSAVPIQLSSAGGPKPSKERGEKGGSDICSLSGSST